MKLCMIGTGYVGLVSGTCFADLGNKVFCVDKDKIKINKLKNVISPIYEPGLDDLIRNNVKTKRLNFTNDLSKAVIKTFVLLYNKKIIYKDTKLVNWDTKLETAISDLEVEQKEVQSNLYYIKYKIDEEDIL